MLRLLGPSLPVPGRGRSLRFRRLFVGLPKRGFDHALVVGDEVVNAHISQDDKAAFEAGKDRSPKTTAPLRGVTPGLDEGLLPLIGGHG